MTRVIHTGDTHLGYRQYHRPERQQDFLAAFRQVAEDAIADDVDAVVHAGDLFHDRRPNLEDILGTLSVVRTLANNDVPFLAVVGNHEAKRDAQWLDLFESLGFAIRLGDEAVVIDDTAFYGLDFVPRSKRDDLDLSFEPTDADHAALVTHGLFEPFDFGEWDAGEILAASTVEFDALLLGDNHDPGQAEIDGTWLTYCGSTERASASERDERGYNLVTFEDGVDIRRRSLAETTREFVFVDVTLEEGEGIDRVRDRVGEYDPEDAVVVVTIEGEGEPVTPASVEEYALERGALVARVTDHREFPEESDLEVSFADPDDAVHERVREMGLSEAAREIDETVRASKVADANVDDVVEDRVRQFADDAGPEVFEQAPDDGADDGASGKGGGEETGGDRDDGAAPTPSEDPEDQATMEEYL